MQNPLWEGAPEREDGLQYGIKMSPTKQIYLVFILQVDIPLYFLAKAVILKALNEV